jgi:hypothetical protein
MILIVDLGQTKISFSFGGRYLNFAQNFKSYPQTVVFVEYIIEEYLEASEITDIVFSTPAVVEHVYTYSSTKIPFLQDKILYGRIANIPVHYYKHVNLALYYEIMYNKLNSRQNILLLLLGKDVQMAMCLKGKHLIDCEEEFVVKTRYNITNLLNSMVQQFNVDVIVLNGRDLSKSDSFLDESELLTTNRNLTIIHSTRVAIPKYSNVWIN